MYWGQKVKTLVLKTLKKLNLVLQSIATISIATISIAQAPVSAKDPFANLPNNMPMCYLINSRGVILNLDYLCGSGKSNQTLAVTSSALNRNTRTTRDTSLQSSSSICPSGTFEDSGICRTACPTSFYFDRASLQCVQPENPNSRFLDSTNQFNNSTNQSNNGNCVFASDRDARGNLCGGRASTERPGGRQVNFD